MVNALTNVSAFNYAYKAAAPQHRSMGLTQVLPQFGTETNNDEHEVLIVEDDESWLQTLVDMFLKVFGIGQNRIHQAQNVEDAITIIDKKNNIRLVTIDGDLPKKPGGYPEKGAGTEVSRAAKQKGIIPVGVSFNQSFLSKGLKDGDLNNAVNKQYFDPDAKVVIGKELNKATKRKALD